MGTRLWTSRVLGVALAILPIVGQARPAQAQTPVLTIADSRAVEGGTGTMLFSVSLSPASTSAVTVDFAPGWRETANPGLDYVVTPGSLTFEPGQTSRTIAVNVTSDTLAEGEEYFTLTLSRPVGATLGRSSAFGVIVDDEAELGCHPRLDHGTEVWCVMRFPILEVYDPGTATWVPGAGSIRVTARGSLDPRGADEWDDWESRWQGEWYDGDGSAVTSSGRVALTADEGYPYLFSDWQCIEWFDVIDDETRTLREWEQSREVASHNHDCGPGCRFDMTASDRFGSTHGTCWNAYDHMHLHPDQLQRTASFTYTEPGYRFGPATFDSEPGIRVADAASVDESGVVAFVVALDAASTGRVTVDYATADGSAVAGVDYTATSGRLTFEPGEVSRTVEVGLIDDALPEDDETFRLTLANPVGADLVVGSATATIEDDDGVLPNLRVSRMWVPLAAGSGSSVQVEFTARNDGVGPADPSVAVVRFGPDVVLGTVPVPALAPGAIARRVLRATIPQVAPGQYLVSVILDAPGDIDESVESDNVTTRKVIVGPDLRATLAATPPAVATDPTTVVVTTRNSGGDPTAASRTQVYRSANRRLDASDTLVGEFDVPPLAAKARQANALSLLLGSGVHFLIAKVDATATTLEAVEGNNERVARVIVP
jgi:hypothetical protein